MRLCCGRSVMVVVIWDGWMQQRLEEADSYGKLSIMRVRWDKIGTKTRVAIMPDAYEDAKTMLESDVDELRSRSRVDGRG